MVLCRETVPRCLCKWWLSTSLLFRKAISHRLHNQQLLEDTVHDSTKSTLGSGNQMPSSWICKTDASPFWFLMEDPGSLRVRSILFTLLPLFTTTQFKLEHPTQFYFDLRYEAINFPEDCETKQKKALQKYNWTNVSMLTDVILHVSEDFQSLSRTRKENVNESQVKSVIRFPNVQKYKVHIQVL